MSMETIKTQCQAELALVQDAKQLADFWAKYLGKGGEVQKLMNGIKSVPNEEKKAYGQAVNQVKVWVQGLYDEKKLAINELQKYVDDIMLNLTDEHNWYIKEFDIKLAKEENKNIVAVYEVFNEEIDNCGEVFYVILEQIGVEVI